MGSLDGKLVDQQSHSLSDSHGTVDLKIPAGSNSHIPGRLVVTWILKELKWSYCLTIAGVSVPASWTKAKGDTVGAVLPKISSGSPVQAPEVAPVSADSCDADVVPPCLPQGVSYDKETKTFQANIKDDKTKRYICLGEFASSDAAHQKYLEARSRYAPDKHIAPQVPLLD